MAIAHRFGRTHTFELNCTTKAASDMRHRIDLSNQSRLTTGARLKRHEDRGAYLSRPASLIVLRSDETEVRWREKTEG